jgi:hypothetical protein
MIMERLSKIKSGSTFLFTLVIIFASCPEISTVILNEIDIFLIFLNKQEAPVLLSINFAFLILIISLIAALSFFIEKLWDFIFYFAFKGYNQKEYELIKEYLIELLEKDSKYLFSWEKVPGNDSERLIEFLMLNFNIEWIKAAKINKNDDGKTIRITNDTNFLSLTLNNEKNNVKLEIDDGRTDKFIVKTENGELNIYDSYLFSWDNIPGNDNERLIIFLKTRFGIEWAETAKIEKIDNDRTIRLSFENNSLYLRLNNEKTKINLEIDNGRMDEFIVNTENGKLNIYYDSKFINEIHKMKVQPIYGQFLHSYARQTFVNWLARRWDTFHDSATNSIGIIFAIIFGFGFISIEKYTLTNTTWATLLFSFIFILLIAYVGLQRKKELLMSEKLFCISIVDPDVRDAFYHIREIITRGQENKDIEPSLSERL